MRSINHEGYHDPTAGKAGIRNLVCIQIAKEMMMAGENGHTQSGYSS